MMLRSDSQAVTYLVVCRVCGFPPKNWLILLKIKIRVTFATAVFPHRCLFDV